MGLSRLVRLDGIAGLSLGKTSACCTASDGASYGARSPDAPAFRECNGYARSRRAPTNNRLCRRIRRNGANDTLGRVPKSCPFQAYPGRFRLKLLIVVPGPAPPDGRGPPRRRPP